MNKRISLFVAVASVFAPLIKAQTPVISANGVVNGADFTAGQAVAPGSIVSIFGTNLAPGTMMAGAIPLPDSIDGVAVYFNGTIAPLFYVSPTQINAEAPLELTAGTVSVVVTVNGVSSNTSSVQIAPFGPGIFSFNGNALAVNQDGSIAVAAGTLAVASHPASPGDVVSLYVTGLGAVSPSIADGANAMSGGLRTATTTPTVTIGGTQAQVLFAGLSPQFVGVDQLNVMVPTGLASGTVPIQISAGGVTSNTVNLTIGASTMAVPAEYQDLYTQLKTNLDTFAHTISTGWNGATYPVNFAADIYPADNGANGQIANSNYYNQDVIPFVDNLVKLGVKAMKVTVSFPVLYQPYYQAIGHPEQYQPTVDNYTALAAYVHSKGIKLIVDSQVVHSFQQDISGFLSAFSMATYQQGRSQVINTLIQIMQPDYVIVQAEPSTETADVRTNASVSPALATPVGDAAFVQGLLDGINNAGLHNANMLIGSGMGTWQNDFSSLLPAIVAVPSLQFLDIHVYPINNVNGNDYLGRILTMADTAHAAGKKVGMSEAWLYKIRDSELGQGFTSTQIYSRDVFSFWSPLDIEFLQDMVNASEWKQLEFMSPFYDKYFFAYLDYYNTPGCPVPPESNCTAAQLNMLANQALFQALYSGHVTVTGTAYSGMIQQPVK